MCCDQLVAVQVPLYAHPVDSADRPCGSQCFSDLDCGDTCSYCNELGYCDFGRYGCGDPCSSNTECGKVCDTCVFNRCTASSTCIPRIATDWLR